MQKGCLMSFLLVIALILGLFAGCATEEKVPGGTIVPNTTAAENEDEPTEAPTAPKPEMDLGSMEGGVYTNKYAGFSVALDEKWTFAGAKELQQLPENIKEILTDSEIVDDMEKYPSIIDMKAEHTEALCTMNVLYQKMDLPTQLSCVSITEKQYIEAMLDQKALLESTYEAAGFKNVYMEIVDVKFAGQDRTALMTSCTLENGVPYYFVQLFYHRLGAYSVTVTLGSFVNDYTEDLMEMFKAT